MPTSWCSKVYARTQRDVLLYVVFLTGGVVLAIEVMAVRILAPYFGNTIFSFSSVISVILAALSVGYWYGGRLADRRPEPALFFWFVCCAGGSAFVLYLTSPGVLPLLAMFLPLTYGPLVAATLLFFVPALLFSVLSPMAIRLHAHRNPTRGIGTVAGEVFFWSTLGSIAGSLSSAFLLVPRFGIHRSMIALSLLVVAVGVCGLYVYRAISKILALGLLVLLVPVFLVSVRIRSELPLYMPRDASVLYDEDGYYERVRVLEGTLYDTHSRLLMLDRQYSSGTTWPGAQLLFPYTRYIDLYRAVSTDLRQAAVLGAGTGTVAKALHERYPAATIDMVDVEPRVLALSHTFFAVPHAPQIREYVADARQFMAARENTYDLVFGDVYASLYSVPWQVSTREYYQVLYDHLRDGGMYIGNYISNVDFDTPSFIGGTLRTMRQVFDHVYLFAVDDAASSKVQNCIVVAIRGEPKEDLREALEENGGDSALAAYAAHLVAYEPALLDMQPLFEDDRTNVDLVLANMIARFHL